MTLARVMFGAYGMLKWEWNVAGTLPTLESMMVSSRGIGIVLSKSQGIL